MEAVSENRGYTVTAAATGINLALGVLYTWSIFKSAIKHSIEQGGAGAFNWDPASVNDPYAVCCLVFAFSMILAGRCQDKFGPRLTAAAGGVMVGAGLLWISRTTDYTSWVLGFGVLAGIGIAFGYSSATPPAIKWFPPNKTGKIAGIVVSGFGLASVYIAPLSKYLVASYGVQGSMMFFGIAFAIVVCLLSTFLVNPPPGYVPSGFECRRSPSPLNAQARATFEEVNSRPGEMLKTSSFWLLWLLYFIGAGAGLMVIGSVAGMAQKSMGANAFFAVVMLAVGNAGGRIAAGTLSDKIGRAKTLGIVFAIQAVLMFAAIPVTGASGASAAITALLVLLSAAIGFNYGANLSLFPSFAKDMWGIKNFGMNYGVLFTAWGVGGFVMSKASERLAAATGTFSSAFLLAGIMLLLGSTLTFMVKDEKSRKRAIVAKVLQEAAVKA